MIVNQPTAEFHGVSHGERKIIELLTVITELLSPLTIRVENSVASNAEELEALRAKLKASEDTLQEALNLTKPQT